MFELFGVCNFLLILIVVDFLNQFARPALLMKFECTALNVATLVGRAVDAN